MKDLASLCPKAVANQIDGITYCPGTSAVELALPINAAEHPKLSFATMVG